jgi:predicted adenylyl cyclase CyaB
LPRNLELKARYRSLSRAQHVAKKLGAVGKGILRQTDTYFAMSRARLKLRERTDGRAELIFYSRPNTRSGRVSDYVILPVSNSGATKHLLSRMFGMRVIVKKKRSLFLYKNARIHIDTVNRLGSFIEFEVLIKKGKPQAQKLLAELRQAFGIHNRDVVGGSYSDLLLRNLKGKT